MSWKAAQPLSPAPGGARLPNRAGTAAATKPPAKTAAARAASAQGSVTEGRAGQGVCGRGQTIRAAAHCPGLKARAADACLGTPGQADSGASGPGRGWTWPRDRRRPSVRGRRTDARSQPGREAGWFFRRRIGLQRRWRCRVAGPRREQIGQGQRPGRRSPDEGDHQILHCQGRAGRRVRQGGTWWWAARLCVSCR